jgi:putative tryptophan/tyrosine transport system substrate-binding protein
MRHALRRIAVVHHGSPTSPAVDALRKGLLRRGFIEGVTCSIDAAGAEGRWALLPGLIEQLLRCQPDVLVAIGGLAALSAQRATSRVPILHAIVLDPLDIGLDAPNVKGVTTFDTSQAARHLRLLGQLVPGLRTLGYLTDAEAPNGQDGCSPLESQLARAATAQGIELICASLSGSESSLEDGFHALKRGSAQALVALEVPAVLSRLMAVSALAERNRMPMLSPYGWPEGGVVMRGAALYDAIEPLAEVVACSLGRAAVPEQPLRTVRCNRLVVHCGRARGIGLQVPRSVLNQATVCIDNPWVDGLGEKERSINEFDVARAGSQRVLVEIPGRENLETINSKTFT